jgi:hypothetical protein
MEILRLTMKSQRYGLRSTREEGRTIIADLLYRRFTRSTSGTGGRRVASTKRLVRRNLWRIWRTLMIIDLEEIDNQSKHGGTIMHGECL